MCVFVLFWFFVSLSPSFQDFDVQGSRRCSSDWLTIGSYKNMEGYRACGSSIPSPYISSQDHVWIRFHSDDSISRKGFRLAYFAGMFQVISSSVLWFYFLFSFSRAASFYQGTVYAFPIVDSRFSESIYRLDYFDLKYNNYSKQELVFTVKSRVNDLEVGGVRCSL